MKLATAALVIAALVFTSANAEAFDFDSQSPAERYAARNCAWCHGSSLQGFSTAPRLAGQQAGYVESQILNFKTHSRDNPNSQAYMWGAAHIDRETARDIGLYLASLEPQAAQDGRRDLEQLGSGLYRDGNPVANVPSCVVCHGPKAEGIGVFPRVGGLSYSYLKRRLSEWGAGYHASAVFPMPAVATNLSAEDIDALASYLSFVR